MIAAHQKERIISDQECIGSMLNEACERGVDIAFVAGLHNNQLQTECARRFLHFSQLVRSRWKGWV